jgi:hypothetical protein
VTTWQAPAGPERQLDELLIAFVYEVMHVIVTPLDPLPAIRWGLVV